MEHRLLTSLNARRKKKQATALVTMLNGGGQWLVGEDLDGGAPQQIVNSARAALVDDKSQLVDNSGSECFIHVYNPPLRMVLVGAVHIAQALAAMAKAVGYEVAIVDPRGAFATQERFPGLKISNDWPDEALEKFSLDVRSAVVTLTHDPKLDDAALQVALAEQTARTQCYFRLDDVIARAQRIELGIEKGHDPRLLVVAQELPGDGNGT